MWCEEEKMMKKLEEFRNLKILDFKSSDDFEKMQDALKTAKSEFGKHHKAFIGGKWIDTPQEITSTNPANPSEIVGFVASCGEKEAEMALDAAWKAFETWRFTKAQERAQYLLKIAEIMVERRYELDSWMVYEVGKNWTEADGDVAEAVDTLNYYAREALRYSKGYKPYQVYGEKNEVKYIPLGAGVIIPPWNFPVAILTGMTSAAIAAGNTVLLKPASISSVIGSKVAEIFCEAGLPDGVFNFVPGSGSKLGDYLVKNPKTRFIAFTGSRDVGLRINELAAQHQKDQKWIKRVILEMGGKDATVVDETADLDAAAEGIVVSAFGNQGQKCSACSRVIAVDAIYDKLLDKVIERTKKIKVGDLANFENWMGPVSGEEAFKKIMGYIEIGKKEGKLALGGNRIGNVGFFIEPTIFSEVKFDAKIAQEEIFGPVLSFIRAKDFDDAVRIFNSTEYGLTGGAYTKDRNRIKKVKAEFHVGNLYINRKITGALIGVQPFGGFNMSGTDSKAGGRDYLLLFLQAQSIAEKI
jgi:1-pyrroline-5-carboxylate dehydrogenase